MMVDSARADRAIRAYLRTPGKGRPPEALDGLAAAASLALRWTGLLAPDLSTRRELFESIAGKIPGLGRLLDAAANEEGLDLGGLARDLASAGGGEAQTILARHAYACARSDDAVLTHAKEDLLRVRLADAGCPLQLLRSARSEAFPGYRDAWELLGLSRNAGHAEIKRAFRKKSRIVHPDAGMGAIQKGGSIDSSDFRALREAYEYLESQGDAD